MSKKARSRLEETAFAIYDGQHAADPLVPYDQGAISGGSAYLTRCVRLTAADLDSITDMIRAAYSLGARHALERFQAQADERERELQRIRDDVNAAVAQLPDEETICLGDEPRPPGPHPAQDSDILRRMGLMGQLDDARSQGCCDGRPLALEGDGEGQNT